MLELVHPAQDDRERDRLEERQGDHPGLHGDERRDQGHGADDRGALESCRQLPQQHAVRDEQDGEGQDRAVGGPLMSDGIDREREDADRQKTDAEAGDRLRHESRRRTDTARPRRQLAQAHPKHPR
jgi:hypothetical protein